MKRSNFATTMRAVIVGIALAAVGIAALLCWGVGAFAVGRVRAGPIRPDEVDRGDG